MFEKSINHYLSSHACEHLRLRAVLFDMDGVLFDSMPYHADAWTEVMNRHGLHFTRQEAFLHEGRTGAASSNRCIKRNARLSAAIRKPGPCPVPPNCWKR